MSRRVSYEIDASAPVRSEDTLSVVLRVDRHETADDRSETLRWVVRVTCAEGWTMTAYRDHSSQSWLTPYVCRTPEEQARRCSDDRLRRELVETARQLVEMLASEARG